MINYAPVDGEIPLHKRQEIVEFTVERYGAGTEVLRVPHDTQGKIVLLNFWASWCAPCVAEFPLLLEIAAIYKEELLFLGLSSDLNEGAVEGFFKNIDYRAAKNEWIALDENGSITRNLFQTYMLPETLLIDQQGYIVKKYVGTQWSKEEMMADIDALRGAE